MRALNVVCSYIASFTPAAVPREILSFPPAVPANLAHFATATPLHLRLHSVLGVALRFPTLTHIRRFHLLRPPTARQQEVEAVLRPL